MYTSFADMMKAHNAAATTEETVKEETPVQQPVLENLSIVDEQGRQCCPNCRQPFLGLGPTCYYC